MIQGQVQRLSSGGSGTVTDVSVVSANGFAGSVATSTTTPAITLSTTITGILSGNGTAISAATTTGSGSVVLATSPTLVTPNIGVATATTLGSGAVTITSSSASALTAGLNGATNPVLKINASTASQAAGIEVTGAAAGSGVRIDAISSGSNESLILNNKGVGGQVQLRSADLIRFTVTPYAFLFANAGQEGTAANIRFSYVGPTNTVIPYTAGTEFTQAYINMGQDNRHASNTGITTQRDMRISGMTHSFASATGTITNAYALYIDPPTAGTNAAITNAWALGLNGNLQTAGINVNGGATLTALTAGTYTPTLTNVANLDASTAYECQYLRVGNTVTVSGKVDIDPTLTATSTQLGISLPVASNLGAAEDCAGTAFASAIAAQGAAILGDDANDRAQLQYISGDVTNQPMYFTFTYQVI